MELRQVDPVISGAILDEHERFRLEHVRVGERGPALTGAGLELDRLLVSQILSQRDMGMIGVRLLVMHRPHVQHPMHVEQVLVATADAEVHYIRLGKQLHRTYLDVKRRKIGDERPDSLDGHLWCSGKWARRQDCYM